jgi:hypothetical protein
MEAAASNTLEQIDNPSAELRAVCSIDQTMQTMHDS